MGAVDTGLSSIFMKFIEHFTKLSLSVHLYIHSYTKKLAVYAVTDVKVMLT